jgi:cytolysin-activating lysine-acyltransferase
MSLNPARPGQSGAATVDGTPVTQTAGAGRTVFAQRFASVVAVLMQDPNFRQLRLADLEWLVLPPIVAGQCRLGNQPRPVAKDASTTGNVRLRPVAVALWASVSDQVDARLAMTLDKPVVLSAAEWTGGKNLWVMAIAGDPRALPAFIGQLEKQDFKDKTAKVRARILKGQTQVLTLSEYRLHKATQFSASGKPN